MVSPVLDTVRPSRLLLDYFRDTATANALPAVRWGNGASMSWQELGVAACHIANLLRAEYRIAPGDPVGVFMAREPLAVVAMYAILLAGGVYFPIDPASPPARRASMLDIARCRVICSSGKLDEGPPGVSVLDMACRVDAMPEQDRASWPDQEAVPQGSDPAYLIFTSGSSGSPKGVLVSHAALANRLEWHQHHSAMGVEDVILQRTALTFDVSLWELFLPALNGGSHYLLRPGLEAFPRGIVHALTAGEVSIVHFVPSLLKPVLQELSLDSERVARPSRLRQMYVSGEALPASLVGLFHDVLGETCGLCNLYGPTEAAIDVSYHDCIDPAPRIVPIGKALPGCRLLIVDPLTRRPLAPETVGEIALAGTCLAAGYLNRQDLTDQVFVHDAALGERIYLTGDLGWCDRDGCFHYVGRKDDQVKLRGLRIELGEIEHHLLTHPQIAEAAAAVILDANQEQWLVAAIVSGDHLPAESIRSFLEDKLPEYMLPTRAIRFSGLPRTASGKLDRQTIARDLVQRLSPLIAA